MTEADTPFATGGTPLGASASPPAGSLSPVGGDAPVIPADPAEALAMRDGLRHDKGFAARFASNDPAEAAAARNLMNALNKAAFPDPAGTAPQAGTPEAARAEIDALRSDPSFIKKYAEGDYQARQQIDRLHEQAYGDPAVAAAAAGEPLPLVFGDTVPEAEQTQMRALADETITTLGNDRADAVAAVDMIERAHLARRGPDGNPREMDDTELLQMERGLKTAWGDQYDAKLDRVEAALRRAGAGGEWLRKSLLHAGPAAVVGAFQHLANIEPKGPSHV